MTTSPLTAPDPAALMGQVKGRAPDAARNIRDQHIVSQALLRRFTRSVPGNAWQLLKIDLSREPTRSHFSAPKGCGVIPEFVPYASASLEHYWSLIENRFRAAFDAVDDGSLFARAGQPSAVRDMAALHFVRSLQMKHAHYASFGNALAHQKAAWRSHPQLLRRIYQEKTGLYTTGSQAIEYILGKLFGETAGQSADGALLRERVVDIYEKARHLIDGHSVEILTPATGEFLIGDIPAVSIDSATGSLGVAGGVALLDADALALPLGRGHLAWLHPGTSSGYRSIPADKVNMANAIQVLAAQRYVFTHPRSGLDTFAAQVRKNQRYP